MTAQVIEESRVLLAFRRKIDQLMLYYDRSYALELIKCAEMDPATDLVDPVEMDFHTHLAAHESDRGARRRLADYLTTLGDIRAEGYWAMAELGVNCLLTPRFKTSCTHREVYRWGLARNRLSRQLPVTYRLKMWPEYVEAALSAYAYAVSWSLVESIGGGGWWHYAPGGRKVFTANGEEFGIIISSRPCRLGGCNSLAYGVRWPDRKRTWPCAKGLVPKGLHYQIAR